MSNQEPIRIREQLPMGFQNLILVVTLLLVFLMASRTPLDTDMWWHLRSGQIMVETGKPLLTDMFSYTRAGADWTNHSWLGEVFLYGIYQLTSWGGLSAWMGLTAALTAWLLWLQIPGGAFTRAGFVLLASIVSAPLWTPRPQLFSILFLAGLAWLVKFWLRKDGKVIWFSLPLFVLWSNIHGGFVLGIIYLITCATGLCLDGILRDSTLKTSILAQAKGLIVAAVGGYAVAAINPNGYRMWLIPFETVGVGVLRQFIQEWASPDFHSPEVWPFAFFVLFLFITQSLNSKKANFQHLIPAVVFILMSLYARRNIAAAAIVTIPWLVSSWIDIKSGVNVFAFLPEKIQQYLNTYRNLQMPMTSSWLTRFLNLGIVAVLGLFCFLKLAAVTHPVILDAFEKKSLPFNAVTYLKSEPLAGGRIFNTYNWGGYLIWKYPEQKVYVDGRTDLYGDEILSEWLNVVQAGDGWEDTLSKWEVTRVLIEPDRPLAKVLPYAGWTTVYQDHIAIIFDKPVR